MFIEQGTHDCLIPMITAIADVQATKKTSEDIGNMDYETTYILQSSFGHDWYLRD